MYAVGRIFGLFVLVAVIAFVCKTQICFSAEEVEGKVNINTATEAQIAMLPGLGQKLASEVINYRTSNGNFKMLEDIKKVSGVGDKKFEKIRNLIILEGDTTIKLSKVAKGKKESGSEAEKQARQ